jgi:DNA-binding NtrC family response regulator
MVLQRGTLLGLSAHARRAVTIERVKGTEGNVIAHASTVQQELIRGPVLVVDADPAVRRVLRLVLEGAGYGCIGSESVDDAEALIGQVRPKLVLVEVNPLEPDGPQLARKLAQGDGWRPRIALMSAYPRQRAGFEDYFLPMPIEFDRLLAILETIEQEPNW